MYRPYSCLKCRLISLLNFNLERSSITLELRGRELKVRAPFMRKLPWYLVVLAKGKRSKSRFLVLKL